MRIQILLKIWLKNLEQDQSNHKLCLFQKKTDFSSTARLLRTLNGYSCIFLVQNKLRTSSLQVLFLTVKYNSRF